MLRLPLLAAALLASPAPATTTHDWIDPAPPPLRVTALEVRFGPLARIGETTGLAAALEAETSVALARWNATTGRPVRAIATVEGLKWASLGVAIVGGTSDDLGTLVELVDPETGARVGRLFIDVWRSHGGLLGMAIRGNPEKELAEEFAEELARATTGRRKP